MKTVTFYSYKGGVGRTLLLANMARYLSRFGQKVFALDFDLEAPGLHYKLLSDDARKQLAEKPGVVDYIHSFAVDGRQSESLRDHVVEVHTGAGSEGSIFLMPAGNVPTAEYWQRLARLNWHELFYSEAARGIPFFLELKARIAKEYSPDYLLIDSRTGITEIGGVATTILPDIIVCLLLNNPENLDGAREVLRSILRTRRLRDQESVAVVPVLARVPVSDDDHETGAIEAVRDFLNEDAPDIGDTLHLSELFVLHSEPSLELKESLLVEGSGKSDAPLFRDYIRLIARLVPPSVLTPHIVPMVQEALTSAWDDPDKAEKDLVALCEHSTVPEPHQALIKLYSVSKARNSTILHAARRYWEMTGCDDDPLLMDVVRKNFEADTDEPSPVRLLDFVEAVWRKDGAHGDSVGLKIAELHMDSGRPETALEVVRTMCQNTDLGPEVAAGCLSIVRRAGDRTLVTRLIETYKGPFASDPVFGSEWRQAVLAFGGAVEAAELLRNSERAQIRELGPLVEYYQLLRQAGESAIEPRVLQILGRIGPDQILQSVMEGMTPRLASAFYEMIESPDLNEPLRKMFAERFGDKTYFDEILRRSRGYARRSRRELVRRGRDQDRDI